MTATSRSALRRHVLDLARRTGRTEVEILAVMADALEREQRRADDADAALTYGAGLIEVKDELSAALARAVRSGS